MAYTTIDDPSAYFQTALYSGNAGTQSITNDGNSDLQPNWVWIKQRSGTQNHNLQDSVRGSTKILKSNTTADETTDANGVTSFNTDGFSIGTRSDINQSGTYVAWQWKAGTTSGITTTNSTITPAGYSFNQTAGFSIIKYPGNATNDAKCPHGLGVAPKMIMIKDLGVSANWEVYHEGIGNTKVIHLNTTGAEETTSARWRNTSPDAVNWTMGSTDAVNGSGNNYIAYCFAEKQGYSKFSSYVGNGSDTPNGIFIYLGFKPAFILIKATDSNSWVMVDNKRPADSNPVDSSLAADSTATETTADNNTTFDFLSNGFKTNGNSGNNNSSGQKYIFMAFAEQPFVSSSVVPATAR